MTPTNKVEQLFKEVTKKIKQIPYFNYCQDTPPKDTHHQGYQLQNNNKGILVNTPNKDSLFVPQEIYEKLSGKIQKQQNGQTNIITKTGISILTIDDKIALGELAYLLKDFTPKHI